MLQVLSEYSLLLTVTQNETIVDPRGLPAVLLSGTGWVLGYPRGPIPAPGPAVHSIGYTALHWAAIHGNRRIVRSLVGFNADVNARDDNGCAVSACGESAECAGRVAAAIGRAGTRRCTLPRSKATPTASRSCCCAAPTGSSRTTRTKAGNAALRRTAEPNPQQPRARRWRPKQRAKHCGTLAEYEAGERQVHSARRLTAHTHTHLPMLLVPTDVPSVLAVGVRRSSGQGGDAALAK